MPLPACLPTCLPACLHLENSRQHVTAGLACHPCRHPGVTCPCPAAHHLSASQPCTAACASSAALHRCMRRPAVLLPLPAAASPFTTPGHRSCPPHSPLFHSSVCSSLAQTGHCGNCSASSLALLTLGLSSADLPPHLALQNSRVGQATVAIVEYIRKHQEHYLTTTGTGVPERMLRWVGGAGACGQGWDFLAGVHCGCAFACVCLPPTCRLPQPASPRSSHPSCPTTQVRSPISTPGPRPC